MGWSVFIMSINALASGYLN